MINFFILLSQGSQSLGRIGEGAGLGPFGNIGLSLGEAGGQVANVVSKVIGVITVAAGIWFIIQFMVGSFKWLNSGGDKGRVEEAREHMTQAVVGLAIVVAAYVIAGLVGAIFGLDILNPAGVIGGLGFGGSGAPVEDNAKIINTLNNAADNLKKGCPPSGC